MITIFYIILHALIFSSAIFGVFTVNNAICESISCPKIFYQVFKTFTALTVYTKFRSVELLPWGVDSVPTIHYCTQQGGEPTSWSLMFPKKISSDQVIK